MHTNKINKPSSIVRRIDCRNGMRIISQRLEKMLAYKKTKRTCVNLLLKKKKINSFYNVPLFFALYCCSMSMIPILNKYLDYKSEREKKKTCPYNKFHWLVLHARCDHKHLRLPL